MQFNIVSERVQDAKAIAWDTCHKIYLLMDDLQVAKMREYGYEALITLEEATPIEMLNVLYEWFDESCELRFIEAVSSETGFETLIAQEGFETEADDDLWLCPDCDEEMLYWQQENHESRGCPDGEDG